MIRFILRIYGLQIFWLVLANEMSAAETLNVLIQSGECKYSPKYFENFNMSIINNTVNMDMMLINPMVLGLKSNIEFSVSLGKTKHYQRIFGHNIDVCAVVTSVQSKSIFKTWFESMLHHGNFMFNCPVPEGHYFLRNWKIDSQLVPQYLYAGDYRITAHLFYGKPRTKQEEFVLDMSIFAVLSAN